VRSHLHPARIASHEALLKRPGTFPRRRRCPSSQSAQPHSGPYNPAWTCWQKDTEKDDMLQGHMLSTASVYYFQTTGSYHAPFSVFANFLVRLCRSLYIDQQIVTARPSFPINGRGSGEKTKEWNDSPVGDTRWVDTACVHLKGESEAKSQDLK